jgi:hypothetical protein
MDNHSQSTDQNKTSSEFRPNSGDEVAQSVHDAASSVADAGKQAAQAGDDVLRHAAESARDTVQTSMDTAAQSFKHGADQVSQSWGLSGPHYDEMARRSTQNIQTVTEVGTILAKGAQDVSREWVNLAQQRATKNIDGLSRLANCRSVQDLVTAQSELMQTHFQLLIDGNKRIAELSLRVVDEAARTLQARVEKAADRMHGAA